MTTQMTNPKSDRLSLVRAARIRRELSDLEYRRQVRDANRSGFSQSDIARAVGVTQPSVHSTLKNAEDLPEIPEGFTGAGPYEIIQQYALGMIDRAELKRQLVAWKYPKPYEPTYPDTAVPPTPPGSWKEVVRAADEGMLDDELYTEILEARHRPAT
ncbi:MAG: hypothetical protein Q4G21_09015 [Dermabacter sp.]|nr:hypothetical protein [Dermabacter sp.]